MKCVFVAVLFVVGALAAPPLSSDPNAAYRILNLPSISPQPSYAMYSGYIILDNGQHLFYWLIEAETNPDTAPLLMWMNGGTFFQNEKEKNHVFLILL